MAKKMKSMSKSMSDESCDACCGCGMHLCNKCAPWQVIFGLLFIVAGMGWFTASWFTGWNILGAYLLLWGASSMMMKKM